MKNILLKYLSIGIALSAFQMSILAQKFYGTGGNISQNKEFTVSYDFSTNKITKQGNFDNLVMAKPQGELVHCGNGVLVGVTMNGGDLYGAIYKTDTTTDAITLLYSFNNTNRANSGFVMGNDGKLYTLGQTATAGSTVAIYSFDITTKAYTQVHAIPAVGGSSSTPKLLKASNGILYGVTSNGGANGKGILFSYNTTTSVFTSLYDFNATNGTEPNVGLTQASNGKLYGVTSYGGANDKGVLFRFDIATNTYNKLFDFVQSSGESPASPLYQASNGKLYSTTMTGGANYQGVLYSFDLQTNTYTNLHSFFAGEGYNPRANPIETTSGKLVGTTGAGGANYKGTMYSYDIATSTFAKIFDGTDTLTVGSYIFSFQSATVGMAEIPNAIATTLFPNPCKDMIHFQTKENYLRYEIVNQLGQLVQTGLVSNNSIPTNDLNSGIYSVKLANNEFNLFEAQRFIKE